MNRRKLSYIAGAVIGYMMFAIGVNGADEVIFLMPVGLIGMWAMSYCIYQVTKMTLEK